MEYNDLRRYQKHNLCTPWETHTSTVYNFTNRAMLTDRPYRGTNPYHSLPLTTTAFSMDSSIHIPTSANNRIVSTNTAGEYADRFHSRPSGRPHVVGFDGRVVTSRSGRHDSRGFNGFFPSVKLRVSTPTKSACESTGDKSPKRMSGPHIPKSSRSNRSAPPPFILELAPEKPDPSNTQTSTRTGPARVMSGRSTKATHSQAVSAHSSRSTARSMYDSHPPVYPYIIEDPQVQDLTELPKPMMVVSRDNPWVYRYKVKRSMNELSKILASKPPPYAVSQSTFIH